MKYVSTNVVADDNLFSGQNLSEYRDQTDIFYESPLDYLKQNFPSTVDPSFPPSPLPITKPGSGLALRRWDHHWPSHLIFFGALLEDEGGAVRDYLESLGYTEVHSIKNGFEEDKRRRGGVKVWMWDSPHRGP